MPKLFLISKVHLILERLTLKYEFYILYTTVFIIKLFWQFVWIHRTKHFCCSLFKRNFQVLLFGEIPVQIQENFIAHQNLTETCQNMSKKFVALVGPVCSHQHWQMAWIPHWNQGRIYCQNTLELTGSMVSFYKGGSRTWGHFQFYKAANDHIWTVIQHL